MSLDRPLANPAAAAAPAAATPINTAPVGTPTQTEVAIEPKGGTFAVPVKINDTIGLKFTMDSGASYVNIPADVASTLVRSGTIAEADLIGDETFMLADGSTVPSALFRIRSLKIGTLKLHAVVGSIGSAKGPLSLGQSFLTRLTTWDL